MKTCYLPEGYLLETPENKRRTANRAALEEAFAEGALLEARALRSDAAHNLHVSVGGLPGVIPREECALGIAEGTTRDIAILTRVNKPVRFAVTGFEYGAAGPVAVLSRREAQRRYTEEVLPCLRPGDVLDVRVTHLEKFGAFCDIGCGVTSLLPIDGISVSRIPHPSVRFAVGDDIRAAVRFVEDGRVTLTHKELLGTWEENAALFHVGDTVSGVVRSVENYGIFVELTPNLAGLAEYVPNVEEGMQASVYIKSLLAEKMKCKLILVDFFEADYSRERPRYFTEERHLSHFRYSPAGCERVIETIFDE
ncbi:MAG: S1 RNA-binding domain-containing protein [Clostridia bacterium]|nr:S1 RNA-binding domain-containing protein [Clostridia bacterium]